MRAGERESMQKSPYSAIIGRSWQRMAAVLFQPFSMKRWVKLGVIAMLAGQLGGLGLNFTAGNKGAEEGVDWRAVRQWVSSAVGEEKSGLAKGKVFGIGGSGYAADGKPSSIEKSIKEIIKKVRGNPASLLMISLSVVAIVAIVLIWFCIRAVFLFSFIESIARNRVEMRISFNKNVRLGASYFYWNVFFGATSLALLGAGVFYFLAVCNSAGIFNDLVEGRLSGFPPELTAPIALLGAVLSFIMIVGTLSNDFVPIVMFSRGIRVGQAWWRLLAIMGAHLGSFVVYFILKILLAVLFIVVALFFILIWVFFVAVMGVIAVVTGYFILRFVPEAYKVMTTAALAGIGVPFFIFLLLLLRISILPVAVFFRAFAMHTLGSVDEPTDLFMKFDNLDYSGNEVHDYKRVMGLFMTGALLPLLPLLLVAGAILHAAPEDASKVISEADIKTPSLALPALTVKEEPAVGIKEQAPAEASGGGVSKTPLQLPKPVVKEKKPVSKIYLKNGKIIRAVIIRETESGIMCEFMGGTFTVNKVDVKRVERQE